MRTRVGYTGGLHPDPTYHQLGDHTEALQVDFDPARMSYAELLSIFWESHRPQRPPYRTQYRSVLFYADASQQAQAEASRDQVAAKLSAPVLTSLEPLGRFYRAEDYHQKYVLRRHPEVMAAFAAYTPTELTDSTVAARLNSFLSGEGSPELLEREGPSYGLDERALRRLGAGARRR